jgi:DNA-3-methyladenine glycosylase II
MQTVKTKHFDYGTAETAYLKKSDSALGEAIERLGRVERLVIPDLFHALLYAIIGQQVSAKAAQTVWRRLQESIGDITPKKISETSVQEIQKYGMTVRKAGYIVDAAKKMNEGSFNLEELKGLSDSEVIGRLSSLNGIGTWTAEMLLINSMERQDIVSWGDLAIKRGMMKLYGNTEITKEQFDGYKKRYSPYGSVASIYLWRISFE